MGSSDAEERRWVIVCIYSVLTACTRGVGFGPQTHSPARMTMCIACRRNELLTVAGYVSHARSRTSKTPILMSEVSLVVTYRIGVWFHAPPR